jgi:hypothetical protein
MKDRSQSIWLFVMGTLYLLLAINTTLGIFFSEGDPLIGAVILINSLIYYLGLLERKEDIRKRASHLLVGSFFSYSISIYQVIMIFSVWLEGLLSKTCFLSLQLFNPPIIVAGLVASFIVDLAKKSFE